MTRRRLAGRRLAGRRLVSGGLAGVLAGALIALAGPAVSYADVKGQVPNDMIACGALRDIPNEWTTHANGYCNSPGNPWTYSYILTSPTVVHSAIWTFDQLDDYNNEPFEVDAYIPSAKAGATVNYYYQLCGDPDWLGLGTLHQQNDSGWYTIATIFLFSGQSICGIKEQSADVSGNWYMAEDALGLSNLNS